MDSLGFEPGPYLRASDPPPPKGLRSLMLVVTRPLQGEARELCQKMLQAMKMPASQIRHLEISEPSLGAIEESLRDQTQICLVMGLEIAAEILGMPASPALRGQQHSLEKWGSVSIFSTHSPEDVLSDASLKRPVWDDLQAAMKTFVPEGRF